MLWLWRRPAATTPIRPPAWEPAYAAGAALEKTKKDTKKKKKIFFLIEKKNLRTKTGLKHRCPRLMITILFHVISKQLRKKNSREADGAPKHHLD